jgi:hypothetical protein
MHLGETILAVALDIARLARRASSEVGSQASRQFNLGGIDLKRVAFRLLYTCVFASSIVAAFGCALIEKHEAVEMERTLAAAGFQIKLADTPEKLAHLQTLTQRRLVPHDRDGEVFYVYADALDCKCLYAGDEKAYQAYQQLAIKQKLAEEQLQAAEENDNAAVNWGMW